MSENLDLVRSIYADWERGDYRSVEWAQSGIEFVIVDGPSAGVSTGLEGMADGWRDILGGFEELRTEVEEYRELDNKRVLVLNRRSGRAKSSGLDLGQIPTSGAALFN